MKRRRRRRHSLSNESSSDSDSDKSEDGSESDEPDAGSPAHKRRKVSCRRMASFGSWLRSVAERKTRGPAGILAQAEEFFRANANFMQAAVETSQGHLELAQRKFAREEAERQQKQEAAATQARLEYAKQLLDDPHAPEDVRDAAKQLIMNFLTK